MLTFKTHFLNFSIWQIPWSYQTQVEVYKKFKKNIFLWKHAFHTKVPILNYLPSRLFHTEHNPNSITQTPTQMSPTDTTISIEQLVVFFPHTHTAHHKTWSISQKTWLPALKIPHLLKKQLFPHHLACISQLAIFQKRPTKFTQPAHYFFSIII